MTPSAVSPDPGAPPNLIDFVAVQESAYSPNAGREKRHPMSALAVKRTLW